ncbi:FecR domain-containing protein [Chitinophaga sp. YIM B06452]|uniref:FecR family protein n=1 Tax=Chitinophaga sp. YIM B06452 TaxID=3082158 RepID=UPI0031FEE246
MDSNRINALYRAYLDRNMSPEELEEFRQVILDTGQEAALDQRMDEHWNELAGDALAFLPKDRADEVFNRIVEQQAPASRRIRLWPRVAVAAAAVGAIIFGISLFADRQADAPVARAESQVNIPAGTTGATLTLSNGKKIKLSEAANGELAEEAGVVIRKSPGGQLVYEVKGAKGASAGFNKLSTARGETYQIHLPDGSDVWLNSASSLVFSSGLISNGKRLVQLEGEAYFEVAKDKRHPFVVQSHNQDIEVVGTHFNVNAYPDEPVVATTLLEGAIDVSAGGTKRRIRPGEQALNKAGQITIQPTDTDNIIDWKNGDFALNNIEFKTAMRKIARWYDMEIIYDDAVPDNLESGGWISRQKPLAAVLKSIESSGLVKFRVEGRKIYVTR